MTVFKLHVYIHLFSLVSLKPMNARWNVCLYLCLFMGKDKCAAKGKPKTKPCTSGEFTNEAIKLQDEMNV